MAVDPAEWLTVFEVLEQTTIPYTDILRLADEGLLTTRPSGQVVLYRADDVRRLVATGHALVLSTPEVEVPTLSPKRQENGRFRPFR